MLIIIIIIIIIIILMMMMMMMMIIIIKYQELKREIGRIWSCRKVIVVPIAIGAQGTFQQKFENIVEENWTRLHVITTKSLLVGNGKNLEKNT